MNKRIDTFSVKIGDIFVGSKHPIRVQSMTNTLTANIDATVAQIIQLHDAGSEIVRITVNDEDSAISVEKIKNKLVKMNCNVPLVGDFHFNGHLLLSSYPDAAAALDKYRINPGNIGGKTKFDNNFEKIINIAIKNNKPVRIGANWGSLNKETMDELLRQKEASDKEISYSELIKNALVKSVIESASKAISLGLPENNIILSCKTSNVSDLVDIYTDLSSQCRYPLHLGLTEAGLGRDAIISSVAALSILINRGIGDTIRVSLTPDEANSRTEEVEVCKQVLSSLGHRNYNPRVISCPGCGRTSNNYFVELSKSIKEYISDNMPNWKKSYPGVENMNIAVMGCIVNGPGESKHANIGISLPGNDEDPSAPVYIDGKKYKTLKGVDIEGQFIDILQRYIEETYK
ncbi:MAG: flavodoxin-dependent (E)-4-hydroxy-3-methylbut-2-enyl-diphosphate synthase [Pseudomonadota bacterium]|nr:flavodoxin-dependent (E)-4-hydroxy-3-methylbut-2-enyl-diphosphate synthase [Pseudomonadota bacterium]|tara:strand:- start:832 stop:2040 length:1209 start_codon:yes stop_codon:yes gene_type:complete